MDIQATLKRNPDLLAVDMDGETVMMDMESGNYFGINEVGSHIWELLESNQSIESIIESVQESFQAEDGQNVQDDVISFLNDMQEQALVEITGA